MSELDTEDRVQRLEYALFGLTGNNGLRSEVRGVRDELRDFINAEAHRRRVEAREKKSDRRWQIGTAISIIVAIIAAAGIVAGAL